MLDRFECGAHFNTMDFIALDCTTMHVDWIAWVSDYMALLVGISHAVSRLFCIKSTCPIDRL